MKLVTKQGSICIVKEIWLVIEGYELSLAVIKMECSPTVASLEVHTDITLVVWSMVSSVVVDRAVTPGAGMSARVNPITPQRPGFEYLSLIESETEGAVTVAIKLLSDASSTFTDVTNVVILVAAQTRKAVRQFS